MLHHVVKDAQTPLSVGPRPVGTLNATQILLVLNSLNLHFLIGSDDTDENQ